MAVTLVTGANGFVGSLFCLARSYIPLEEQGVPIDIRNEKAVRDAIERIRPDNVVHLAAQSFVPESFRDPHETISVNFIGTLNLLTALRNTNFQGKFLFISTGDVYGNVPEQLLPVDEGFLPKPRSPYSVSKLAAESLCYQWSQSEKARIVIARPFNHVGPGQSDRFVLSDIAKQLVTIKRRSAMPTLLLGDVDVTRDFTDVDDIMDAYDILISKGESGEIYNICSGHERSIRNCINEMASILNLDVNIQTNPKRLRVSEQRRMVGSPKKIKALGWSTKTSWRATLSRLLEYWDNEI